jgi:hypothetical protein
MNCCGGGGITTVLTTNTMTCGPTIDVPSIIEVAHVRAWIVNPEGHGATFLGRPDIFEGGTCRENLGLVCVVGRCVCSEMGHLERLDHLDVNPEYR